MAWYNPISRFKNLNLPLRKAKVINPNDTVEEEAPEQIATQSATNPTLPITEPATTSTTSQVNKPTWSLFLDVYNAFTQWQRERQARSLADVARQNQEQAHQLEDFEPVKFWVEEWWNKDKDNPVDGTVSSEHAGKNWEESRTSAVINNKATNTPLWKLGKVLDVAVNAWEQYSPTLIWAWDVSQATKEAYWWELYDKKQRIWFIWNDEDKADFLYDMWTYFEYEDMYNNNEIGKYQLDTIFNSFYDAYKDNIKKEFERREGVDTAALMEMYQWLDITADQFKDFLNNERLKEQYQKEEYERRWIDLDLDSSRARVAQWIQYVRNEVWPMVQNSNIKTVDARKEYMNDTERVATTIIWWWDNEMTQTYRAKAWLQKIYWVSDMYDIDPNIMTDEHREIRNSIEVNERNYNQFIKNLSKYLSRATNWVDPETWTLDALPAMVIDPSTWKAYTYQEILFDWITMIEWMWWNTYPWDGATSPKDMLHKSSAQIARARTNVEEWFLTNAWANLQYRWSTYLWASVNEFSQQTLWRWLAKLWNIASKESWEVPFELVDMDSSLLATLTTNKSRTWRLLQDYTAKFLEYGPEVIWSVVEAILIDKWLSKIWTITELSSLSKATNFVNRFPKLKWTLAWRQIALWLSNFARTVQRLWTDQIIDATMSIADTEPMSDISKKLSLYGTLFWEGIWILRDWKVLGKSFTKYFNPNAVDWFVDPIKLMVDNPWILDDYAAALWRGAVDESWKIVGDEYKLLLWDLADYSWYLKKLVDASTTVVNEAIKEWVDLTKINKTFKQAVYDVVKQTFWQNSAMAKAVNDLLIKDEANMADIVKYIWSLEWVVKVGPWISTIKVGDEMIPYMERVVKNYNRNIDTIIDWWLIAWINRWLTRDEVESLFRQWFISPSSLWNDIWWAIGDYFIEARWRYYPTEKWLKALNVDSSVINNPLAIATMSEDTKQLIEKLKGLSSKQRLVWDQFLDIMWETNAIDSLAESIAWIDYLNICK